MLKTLSALASMVAAATVVVPTVSQAEETLSVRVPYSDLNLAAQTGQVTLKDASTPQRNLSVKAT